MFINYITKTVKTAKWIGFLLVYVLETIITISFLAFKEEIYKLISSLIVINVSSIVIIIVMNKIIAVSMKKYVIKQKNEYVRMFQSIDAMLDIFPNFFKSLTSLGNIIFSNSNDDKYKSLKSDIEQFTVIKQKYFESYSKLFEKNLVTDQINQIFDETDRINEFILKISLDINREIHVFNNQIVNIKTLYDKMTDTSANMLYQFQVSAEILSSISTESMDYSVKTIKEIFEEFEKISKESEESARDTEKIMSSFINSTNDDSLLYILKETKTFISRFNDFNSIIIDLKTISDTFMDKTLTSLKEIQNIANNINEISEKINLISINVRIEAAHLDSKTSGFQVLGNEISEFAGLTSKIISRANTEINKTLTHISSVKDDYVNKMSEVINYIPEFQKSLTPFESIINGSFNKIKLIISGLYKVSNEINTSIKKIIDKFQYQDITLQETKNIISYINRLSDTFVDISAKLNIDLQMRESEKREINKKIYDTFNGIVTTQKEREIIVEFAKKHNVFEDTNNEATKEFREVDENIILF